MRYRFFFADGLDAPATYDSDERMLDSIARLIAANARDDTVSDRLVVTRVMNEDTGQTVYDIKD